MDGIETQGTTEKTNKKNKRAALRRVLMLGGVGVVLIGGLYAYLTDGRYISTDNAYIKADKILVTPQVSGTITSVSVTDNQRVKKGQEIFRIDLASYKIALAEAQASLANAVTQINQLKAQYTEQQDNLKKAEAELVYARQQYDRQKELVTRGATSKTSFEDSTRALAQAEQSADALQAQIQGTVAALNGNPDIAPQDHPLYKKDEALLEQAQLNLERTSVKATVDGIIGTAPRVGDYAQASLPVLNLIGTDKTWITANYKETELTNVKTGQPVTITVDTYPDHKWHGTVESISPATGSEFSILPAQNATGNWVKIVQRIGVRIAIDAGDEQLPLRTGMSTEVTIDTGRYPHMPFMTGGK